MRSAVIVVTMAAVLLSPGCGEKKRLEGELATATGRITQLEDSLRQAMTASNTLADSLSRTSATVVTVRTAHDSLTKALETASGRARRMEENLRVARTQFQRSIDSLDQRRAELDNQLRERSAQLESSELQLADAREEITQLTNLRDSLSTFLDAARPWYAYYKHDSGRNWAKKLFGAGRGKKPTTPEPDFQTGTPPNFEAVTP